MSTDAVLPIQRGTQTYSLAPLSDLEARWSQGMVFGEDGRLYVGDKEGHQIIVWKDGEVVDTLGRIGQSPGEFYRPDGLSYAGGLLFVADQNNHRIQIVRTDGTPVSDFLVDFVPAYLAGTRDGSVLVNNPRGGWLFDLYDDSGKLLAQGGALLTPGQAYPGRPALDRRTLNRAFLLHDDDDGVYVVFQFVPVIQKWSLAGEKIWGKRMEGERISKLVAGVFGDPDGKAYSTKSTEGEEAIPILVSAACLMSDGSLMLALSDQTLIRLSSDGAAAVSIAPANGRRYTFNAIAEREGVTYLGSESGFFRAQDGLIE